MTYSPMASVADVRRCVDAHLGPAVAGVWVLGVLVREALGEVADHVRLDWEEFLQREKIHRLIFDLNHVRGRRQNEYCKPYTSILGILGSDVE